MGTTPFIPAIKALEEGGVRYVVDGGIAALVHGINRFTADIDFVNQLEPTNARKAMEQMLFLGLKPRNPVDALQFADPKIRESWVKERNRMVFSFISPTDPFLTVDFFVEPPVDFEELYSKSEMRKLGNVSVRVCGIDHLVTMKKKAGRPKDLEDVALLEKLKYDAAT